jgi:hypothetical protein
VVESLKVPTTPAAPETIPDVASMSGSYKSESDVEFDRLLAELEEPIPPSTPEMEIRQTSGPSNLVAGNQVASRLEPNADLSDTVS